MRAFDAMDLKLSVIRSLSVILLLCASHGFSQSSLSPEPGLSARVIREFRVDVPRFDAMYFSPEVPAGDGPALSIMVLPGSGQDRPDAVAGRLASMGHHALSVSYYDPSGNSALPRTLERIALEHFTELKDWLLQQTDTNPGLGVVLYGMSKGTELALLLASHDPDYRAVIGIAPSHVAWQGIPADFSAIMQAPSSWRLNGEDIPFVPYVSREEQAALGFDNRHVASLRNLDAVMQARIPVANINGHVALFSGSADNSWPSAVMGAEVCNAILQAGRFECSHRIFDGGDHLLTGNQDELFEEISRFIGSLQASKYP